MSMQVRPKWLGGGGGGGGGSEVLEQALGTFCEGGSQPDTAEAHFQLALVFGQLGEAEDEVREYERAISLDPTNARAHYNLGTELLSLAQDCQSTALLGRAGRHLALAVELATGYSTGRDDGAPSGPMAKQPDEVQEQEQEEGRGEEEEAEEGAEEERVFFAHNLRFARALQEQTSRQPPDPYRPPASKPVPPGHVHSLHQAGEPESLVLLTHPQWLQRERECARLCAAAGIGHSAVRSRHLVAWTRNRLKYYCRAESKPEPASESAPATGGGGLVMRAPVSREQWGRAAAEAEAEALPLGIERSRESRERGRGGGRGRSKGKGGSRGRVVEGGVGGKGGGGGHSHGSHCHCHSHRLLPSAQSAKDKMSEISSAKSNSSSKLAAEADQDGKPPADNRSPRSMMRELHSHSHSDSHVSAVASASSCASSYALSEEEEEDGDGDKNSSSNHNGRGSGGQGGTDACAGAGAGADTGAGPTGDCDYCSAGHCPTGLTAAAAAAAAAAPPPPPPPPPAAAAPGGVGVGAAAGPVRCDT
jgi:hypothetical protein